MTQEFFLTSLPHISPPIFQAVSDYVANYILQRIVNFRPTAEKPFVLGLPTGSSPIRTYEKLVEFHKQGKLSFEHVVTFNMGTRHTARLMPSSSFLCPRSFIPALSSSD